MLALKVKIYVHSFLWLFFHCELDVIWLQLHPDTDTGDIEKFKELNTAYEQCLNYAKAPHEMTLKELQDRAKE